MADTPSDIPPSTPLNSEQETKDVRADKAHGAFVRILDDNSDNKNSLGRKSLGAARNFWAVFLGERHIGQSNAISPNVEGHTQKKSFSKTVFKSGFKASLLGGYFCAVGVLSWCLWAGQDLPSQDQLWEKSRPNSIRVLDRYGREVLVRGATETLPVNVQELPPHVYLAVLAVEDKRFFEHIGIDPLGLARAVYTNYKAGRVVQGGSTLTQQLAKNAFLTPDRTRKRKIQEAILAIDLERSYTKADILELYLNKVYFGGGAWGIDAAARRYFNKPAKEITLMEAAMLAGLLKAPSKYNPFSNVEKTQSRTGLVLRRMVQAGFIDEDQRQAALRDPIYIHRPVSMDSANYFIDWIWPEVESKVEDFNTDLVIETTLDLTTQNYADMAVKANLDPKRGANEAALIAIDGTGQVRALIGGADYGRSQFNRAVNAKRQPGSAFKPFVFLTALKSGIAPWDYVLDVPVTLGDWTPRNFKEDFKGELTVREAFAKSINTVSVSLSEEVGRNSVIQTASDFGLTGFKPLRSLALGAQDVTPLKLTQAYIPFANFGYKRQAYGIEAIYGEEGRVIYQRETSQSLTDKEGAQNIRVLDGRELGQINMLMREVVNSGSGHRAAIKGRDIGGKTGTTNEFRDAWFVGYVPDYVTGVWVGDDDNRPMKRVSGGTIPAQIWHDFMRKVLENHPHEPLPTAFPPARLPKPSLIQVDPKTGEILDSELSTDAAPELNANAQDLGTGTAIETATRVKLNPIPNSAPKTGADAVAKAGTDLDNLLNKAQTLISKSP